MARIAWAGMARRRVLLAGAAALLARPALAQESWPVRTVQILVGLPPGGIVDLLTRAVMERLSRDLGATFVAIPAPGASGFVALQRLVAAPADGGTLLMSPSDSLTARPIFAKSPIHHDQLVLIGNAARSNGFLMVRQDSPWRGLPDFIEAARRAPGRYTYGTPGAGGVPHIMMEELSRVAGLQLVHAPYNGAPPSNLALTRGDVDLIATGVPASDHRALATYAETRATSRRDAPTFRELGLDLSMSVHFGLVARRELPEAQAHRLQAAFRDAAQSEEVRQVIRRFELEPDYRDPAQFRQVLDAERRLFDRALNALGLVGAG